MTEVRRATIGETTPRQTEKTLADQAYKAMREDLLGGRLQPGSRLRLGEIQLRYGLGMSPVREALMRLASEGLVAADGQRGFSVASVSLDELHDVTRTRERIEAMAIGDAIAHGDGEWEVNMIAAFHRLTRAPLPKSTEEVDVANNWEALHRDFHRALVAACGSPWLLRLHTQLVEHSERYRRVRLFHVTPSSVLMRDVEKEHEAIMKAALARDANKACTLMEKHLRRTEKMVVAQWGPAS
jgi:GntR family transcriptional regulator, carbon starvation induced regulator